MITVEEKKKYTRIQELSAALDIPVFGTRWKLEVRDHGGRLLQEHRQRSHSWTRNAYNYLFALLACINGSDPVWGGGNINLINTGSVLQSGNYALHTSNGSNTTNIEDPGWGYRGNNGSIANGIVVGSGLGAEDFNGYYLAAPIGHGMGAGQLSYILQNAPVRSYDAGTKVYKVEHLRYMNNNSGGVISVNEVCLINCIDVGGTDYCMFARDLLGATVNIPNTGQLKVTYTIELTYPA
ncbi:hypothetical protein ACFLV0_01860 [Chloroflexota bacterium]